MFDVAQIFLPFIARTVNNLIYLFFYSLILAPGDEVLSVEQMINKLYKFDFLDEDFCALVFEVYIFEVFLEGIGKSSIERYLNFEF